MKKTLAIVLALVMVLCMIPAMSADTYTTKTVADKNYTLKVMSVGKNLGYDVSKEKANSITFEYNFEDEDADITGKWTDKAKMALVVVEGFDADLDDEITSVTVDGKKLSSDIEGVGYNKTAKSLAFPVELTKAGYSDSYLIQVVGKKGDVVTTETAKVSVKLVNTAAYKDAKTATVTNIASTDKNVSSIYIVGSKIYVDYVGEMALATAKVTFADENGKAFSGITYAYNPVVKQGDGSFKAETDKISTVGAGEVKLSDSAAKFDIGIGAEDKTVKFKLETKAALYETKAYTIVMRTGIVEEDPKGIYFAESTKTIAMGQTYTPVVMGVKTGKPVAATLVVGDKTDKQVVDLNDDKDTVIGTREGVAYITAEYKPVGGKDTYTSSSMKIIVTLPGESIPPVEPSATTYYVTCRNLNVRKGPGTSYGKNGMIHRGDAVKVVEIKKGWAKLENGTYVASKYIAK